MDGLMTGEAAGGGDYPGGGEGMASPVGTAESTDWEEWLTEHGAAGTEADGQGEGSQANPEATPPEAWQQQEEQPNQSLGFDGWQDPIRQLAEWGVTPEQLAAELQALTSDAARQQGWGEAPTGKQGSAEEQFAGWLSQRDVDPDECTRAELVSLEGAWRQEQMLAHYQQQTAIAQEQALRSQWQSDLQMVESAFPELGNPVLRDALLNLYEGRFGIEADYDQLATVAEELVGTIRTLNQAELARYAQNKQADAMFPVFAGGSSPGPRSGTDFHHLSPTMQQEYLESHFAATGGR